MSKQGSDDSRYFYPLRPFNPVEQRPHAAVFLDRDGVVIEEKHYIKSSRQVEFIEGSIEALKCLNRLGVFVAVVTNQAGVARGLITMGEAEAVNSAFFDKLEENNAAIHCLMYCPYHPDGLVPAYTRHSRFRKPETGMFEFIRAFYHLDGLQTFVVGDKASDVEAGTKLGATSFLVETGFGTEQSAIVRTQFPAVKIVANLLEATIWMNKQLTPR